MNAQYVDSQTLSPRLTVREQVFQDAVKNMSMTSLVTSKLCSGPKYSYCGYPGGPRTLIDHILLPVSKTDLAVSCSVIDDPGNLSDHFPVVMKLNIKPMEVKHPDFPEQSSERIYFHQDLCVVWRPALLSLYPKTAVPQYFLNQILPRYQW